MFFIWVGEVFVGLIVDFFMEDKYNLIIYIFVAIIAIGAAICLSLPEIIAWLSGRTSFKTAAKSFIKAPSTHTWMPESEILKIIRKSSAVMKNSPRRNQPARTMHDTFMSPFIAGPSGETQYIRQHEKDASKGILYNIVEKHPSAKNGDKFSKEIIEFELYQMVL